MRDQQVRVQYAVVQVDARARGDAAAGALPRMKSGKPQVEIVIERTNLMIGNPQLAETSLAEELEPIVPGQRELLGMIRPIGRDRLSRLQLRTVVLGRLGVALQLLPCEDGPIEDL